MASDKGRIGYQLRLWLSSLRHILNLPRFLNRDNRHKLFLAHEILGARLPMVALEEIVGELPDSAAIELQALPYRVANCSLAELFALAVVTRVIAPRCAVEIGTFDGRSTLAIAANVPANAIVHTLNLPAGYAAAHPEQRGSVDVQLSAAVASGHRWVGNPLAARIRQHFGNSRHFDFAPLFPAQLIFIDGAHDEQTVLSDSRNALAGIDRANGAILWDDAGHYGLPAVLTRLRGEGLPIRLIAGTDLAMLRFRGGAAVA